MEGGDDMKNIVEELNLVLKALINATKVLHNYEGDKGVNPVRRSELREKRKEISKVIDVLHDVMNKLREKGY